LKLSLHTPQRTVVRSKEHQQHIHGTE